MKNISPKIIKTREEMISLLPKQIKITELGIKNHVTPNNRIRLSGNKGKQQLLSIIGDCPIECYKYKFL
jgi:hypothetical protein